MNPPSFPVARGAGMVHNHEVNTGPVGPKDGIRFGKGEKLMWFYRSSIGLLKII